jgi:hypothetical protein
MEEYDYLSCIGLFSEGFTDWKEACADVNEELRSMPHICGAATLLSRGGSAVRFLARSASDMTQANKQLWDVARASLLHLPSFDHRKY